MSDECMYAWIRKSDFERCNADLDRLEAENDKLRELVRDMWCDITKSEACGWDIDANCCTGSDSCIGECSYYYRMVKLGIEVPYD